MKFTRKVLADGSISIYKLKYEKSDLDKLSWERLNRLKSCRIKGVTEEELQEYMEKRVLEKRHTIYPDETFELYNGDVIDVDSLSDSDKAKAFKLWAEGSPALEDALWACNENGIKTQACCAGHKNEEKKKNKLPYLYFILEEKTENKMAQLYDKLRNTGEVIMLCAQVANQKIGFQIELKSIENREEIFKIIADTIREPVREEGLSVQYQKFKEKGKIPNSLMVQTTISKMFGKLRQMLKNAKESVMGLFKNKKDTNTNENIIESEVVESTDENPWKLNEEQLDEYNQSIKNKSQETVLTKNDTEQEFTEK